MSQLTQSKQETPRPAVKPIPENLPEELLPLYDWWKAQGPQFLVTLGVVALLVGAAWGFRHYRANRIAQANQAFFRASSIEDLESFIAQYGSMKVGNAARLRLAKGYFDAAKYEDALQAYDLCLRKGAPDGYQEIAELGRAHALEAVGRLEDAQAAYEQFAAEHADYFLTPQAQMGVARVYTLQGKKDQALKHLENLKAALTGKSEWEMTIANLEGVIARYEPRQARSLFDAAEAVSEAVAPAAAEASAAAAVATPTNTPQ